MPSSVMRAISAGTDDATSVGRTEITRAMTTQSESKKRTIVEVEEKGEGAVSMTVYLRHFEAMGGIGMFLFITLLVVAGQACVNCSDYWLAFWTSRTLPGRFEDGVPRSDSFYLSGLALISAVAIFTMVPTAARHRLPAHRTSM
jgi:hypothetical protein